MPSVEIRHSRESGSRHHSAHPEYARKSWWYTDKTFNPVPLSKTKSCKLHLEYSLTSSFENFLKLWLYKYIKLKFRSLSFLFNFSYTEYVNKYKLKKLFLGYLTKLGAKSSWNRKGAIEENAASSRKHWSHQSSCV